MSSRKPASLQAKLDEMFRRSGLDHRKIARLILGEDATQKQIDSLRSQISKWRNTPGIGITAANSARLARAFSKAGFIVPLDYFLPNPSRPEDAIEELQRRVEELERRLAG